MSTDPQALSDFNGVARLFPLPNLVVFPQVFQPLHIFEPRYRQMTADALDDDRLIALALLRPGWEADYEGRPPIHSVACLGRIVADQRLADGRYNILFQGLSRCRIRKELPPSKLYRNAQVERLDDLPMAAADHEDELRQQLDRLVPVWFSDQEELVEQVRHRLRSNVPLGTVCDLLAFALSIDLGFKQVLLEQLDVAKRVYQLIRHMETCVARKFPPNFSTN
jgi:Lon protease-like protein